jgi:hypothetical protein
MHQRKISLWVSLLVLLGLLAGCAAPVDTAAVATEASRRGSGPQPVRANVHGRRELRLRRPLQRRIEAVDELTVKFNLSASPTQLFLPKSPFLPSPSTTPTT